MATYKTAKVFRHRGKIMRPGDDIEVEGREASEYLKRAYIAAKPAPQKPAVDLTAVRSTDRALPKPQPVAPKAMDAKADTPGQSQADLGPSPAEQGGSTYDTRVLTAK